jgi:hypothetical protein
VSDDPVTGDDTTASVPPGEVMNRTPLALPVASV